jgi:Gly-Xaa carboxypeptidase
MTRTLSHPPDQSIGMLSALLTTFENNPFPVEIDRTSPLYLSLQCLAAHAPEMDESVRRIIKKSSHSNKALRKLGEYISKDVGLKSLVSTTQAIDLVGGGVKTNALPEAAWAVVNHRIATQK